jgi:DNA polymerase I-like protein with 3'-5' exonuclease and polymerase domains
VPRGVRTLDELREVVNAYFEFDAFVVDVETMGDHRGEPFRNDVFWISLAGPGRADVIPCGHPLGERILRDPDDPFYRIDPANGHHQEHRINESSGRPKWVDVPEPFTPAPQQLWISDVIDELRPLFFSDRTIIGQNVKFDVLSLTKYFGAIPPGPYGDTLVAAKLIDENQYQYDLGHLVERAFGFLYDKIGKQVEVYPFSEAAKYSYLDAKYTWLLWVLYQRQLDEEGVGHIFDLEMEVTPVILDMEHTGVGIDEVELQKLGDEFTLEMAKLQIDLDEVWMGQGGHNTSINLNANKQVAELVYDVLDKPCKEFTKTGQRAVGKEALEAFSRSHTVNKVLEYKKLSKLQGTFIEGLQSKLLDGRVHPSFNQAPTGDRGQGAGGTVSGRLSCVSADTKIEMPRNLREYPQGVPITEVQPGDWVYAFDWQRELVLKRVVWVKQTGIRETVVITAKNSEGHEITLRLTPDHLVRLRWGDWRAAGTLLHRPGQPRRADGPRLMTMVRRGVDKGYVKFFPHSVARGNGNGSGGKNREHRWIVEQILGKRISTKTDVHHVDENSLNNHPSNLRPLTVSEHRGWRHLHPHWSSKLKKLPHAVYSGPSDYHVTSVSPGMVEPVWDMEVEDVHNFIANGICVHNCSSPNIQQIPSRSERGKRVRDVFVSGPGNVLVVADLSQIELRVLAHFTQDKVLLEAYRRNDDLHSILAARVFGPDFTPFDRSLAKNGNFSVLFGAQASTLVRRYGFPTQKLAQQVLDGFYETYQRVGPWKDKVIEDAVAKFKKGQSQCYVETILGRKRRLPQLRFADSGLRSAAERQAISVTISGSAADLFKVIMVDCHGLLTERSWTGHILMTVHDELVVEVPEAHAEEGLRLVKSAMEDVLNPFTGEPMLSVPVVADAKIVTRWSDGK